MNSRMERYVETEEEPIMSRTAKNTDLYNTVNELELSRVKANDSVKVIENNEKEIDIEKIKKYINSLNQDSPVKRKTIGFFEEEKSEQVEEEETKEYDINTVLEKAKQGREINYDSERYKKLKENQYEILNRIDKYDKKDEEEKKEDFDFNTDEKTLIDLINTVTINKSETGLLDILKDDASKTTTLPINEEKENGEVKKEILKEIEEKQNTKTQELVSLKEKEDIKNIDKSFYTNSMSFSKEDFEGFEELEKSVKKNNVLVVISLIILILAIGITLFVIANYVFDLKLF